MNRYRLAKCTTRASILLALLLWTVPGCAQTGPQRISAGELNTMLADRQAVVVDVRDTGDWDRSNQKIKGAIRLDPRSLDPANLPIAKTATLVLY